MEHIDVETGTEPHFRQPGPYRPVISTRRGDQFEHFVFDAPYEDVDTALRVAKNVIDNLEGVIEKALKRHGFNKQK